MYLVFIAVLEMRVAVFSSSCPQPRMCANVKDPRSQRCVAKRTRRQGVYTFIPVLAMRVVVFSSSCPQPRSVVVSGVATGHTSRRTACRLEGNAVGCAPSSGPLGHTPCRLVLLATHPVVWSSWPHTLSSGPLGHTPCRTACTRGQRCRDVLRCLVLLAKHPVAPPAQEGNAARMRYAV